jgi:Na+-transporting NADH:ubiquinone oxidoreductase subunit C
VNKQSLIYTVIFTFIVSFAFVTILAFANEGTEERVELNQRINRQRAILNALGVEFEGPDDVRQKFDDVEQVERNGITLYRTTVDGETVLAKEFTGSGLWGQINGFIAVDRNVEHTVGLEILSHNETPGLGGRIDEPWFKKQFRGEEIVEGTIRVGDAGEGDENHDNGEVDAITGATRTSESMDVILENELSTLLSALGGSQS